ncbi:MAG: hypothetical protein EPO21_16375 [Chloroflexota bacterium]|nr:MAG: hypothetical protein EPO21_16375 [Chloroflexota bacterium]
MSMYEQLKSIRDKLTANRARRASIAFIEQRMSEAKAVPESPSAPYVSEAMIIRHLTRRQDVRETDIEVDLLNLLPQDEAKPRIEIEEVTRQPKPHSFYRQQKKK